MAAPAPDLVARFRADLDALTGGASAPVGIAVSGGPDSLALLLLAAAALPGAVRAATVDHKLRSESAVEARFVADVCAGLGVPHRILAPRAPPGGNVQSAARALRYRLLGRWAKDEGLGWLLTAHHADDQAETLLMRLNRGAGLSGLAGIRAALTIAGARVARPLLGWRRAALASICAEAGLDPVADPSNEDPAYDRVRLRARLAGADWLDVDALAAAAAHLAEAEAAIDWMVERLAAERIQAGPAGAVALDPAGLPGELRRRLLLGALGAAAPPRGQAVQRLIATLEAGGTATLAGWRCTSRDGRWHFAPAPPRRRR